MLSKSLLAVGIRTEWVDNTQMCCPIPNPKQQLTGLLMPYSKHNGWFTFLSYLGPLSLPLCFPLHLYSVTSTRAQVGLNTPSQRIGRGRHKDPEVVISHSI